MDVLNLTPAQKKQIMENAPATATKYGDEDILATLIDLDDLRA